MLFIHVDFGNAKNSGKCTNFIHVVNSNKAKLAILLVHTQHRYIGMI